MWKYEFEAPVGTRVLKRFFGVTNYEDLWFCSELNEWVNIDGVPENYGASTHALCRSFKAFKRHLRKHPELRGTEVILTSRFMDHNVIARWVE